MTPRKRRFKNMQQTSTSYPQCSITTLEPPMKRRRLSAPDVASINPITHRRQNYLTNNLTKLRNDDKVSDVTFVLTNTSTSTSSSSSCISLSDDEQCHIRKYKCIKALFAANSEVFRNLLYGDFNEAKCLHPEIEIKDITHGAFEYIRDLFYHLNPSLTHDIVLDVAIAAHRYFIYELMSECINYLRNICNINEWYSIIGSIQDKYNNCFGIEIYLRALIDENYMVNNCTQIIFAQLRDLYALNIEMLSRIIESSNVYLCEEVIWHKCIGYALHKTKEELDDDSIPHSIATLIDRHLKIPKQIYEEMKNNKGREYILSQMIDYETCSNHYNIKNYERMIIKQRDILMIDDDDDDMSQMNHETDDDYDVKFIAIFEEIMKKLSINIRFTLMAPLFFIKIVQFSTILAPSEVIEIQNYSLCGVKGDTLITTKREKQYLQYFKEIQLKNKKNIKISTSHSESEEQKQDEMYDEIETDMFYNDQMCLNDETFNNLKIGDHIDHRDNVGRFATAVIVDINRNGNKVKLHYIGWQEKWDLWCELNKESGQQIRFCIAGSISTRRIHRREFKGRNMELTDVAVRCRLALYWYKNHPNVSQYDINEWREANIKRIDKHSGQVQLVVRIDQKDYLWWVHLDSADEVQPLNTCTP